MDVDAFNFLSFSEGKGSSIPRDGCFKCGGAHFRRDCNARKGTGKQSYGKGKQSKSWSKSESSNPSKGKSKENKGKIQRNQKCANQGAKGVHKGNTSKAGLSGLEWNDDWSSVGWREGWEQTYDTSANSVSPVV